MTVRICLSLAIVICNLNAISIQVYGAAASTQMVPETMKAIVAHELRRTGSAETGGSSGAGTERE